MRTTFATEQLLKPRRTDARRMGSDQNSMDCYLGFYCCCRLRIISRTGRLWRCSGQPLSGIRDRHFRSTEASPKVEYTKGEEEDCVFDLATQTDEFIKDIPEFSNYTWIDSTKSAIITLDNGETLIAERGGCNHFGISGKWEKKNDTHKGEEIEYWLEQAKWISKRLLPKTDYEMLEKMIDDKKYESNFHNGILYLQFEGHDYSEWYLRVEWDLEKDDENPIIETGYYFG